MAEENSSSNTATVAIIVLIALVLGFLYYSGIFGPSSEKSTTIETPNLETPSPRT